MCSSCQIMSSDNPQMSSSFAPSTVPWKEIATKAAVTAGVAGALAFVLLPDASVSLGGMSVPQSVGIGLGAATGSVVGDLAHNYILPHIPQSEKYLAYEDAAVSIGASVAGAYIGMGSFGDVSPMTAVLLGGGSYVASDYIYRHFYSQSGMTY